MVAALFNSDLIKEVSIDKYNKIRNHSGIKNLRVKEAPINFTRIPADKIKLPELSKREFTYYKDKENMDMD